MSEKYSLQQQSCSKKLNKYPETILSIEQFEIGPKIGRGQFSEVYKATYLQNDLRVALKKIQIFEMEDAKMRQTCLKEIKLLQKLRHPNIICCYGCFVSPNAELFIALELAEGGDMAAALNTYRRARRLPAERTARRHATQLCAALAHMHSRHIMHRDIKPANVFLSRDGDIKLGDLGLGRFFGSMTIAAHTLVGTPYYMSPERIKDLGYDYKSDIWALGCLLYEIATLQSPFYGENINLYILCQRIEKCDYPPIPPHAFSKEYRDLVYLCINQKPSDRPDAVELFDITKYWSEKQP